MDTIDAQCLIFFALTALFVATVLGGWALYVKKRITKVRRAFAADDRRLASESAH